MSIDRQLFFWFIIMLLPVIVGLVFISSILSYNTSTSIKCYYVNFVLLFICCLLFLLFNFVPARVLFANQVPYFIVVVCCVGIDAHSTQTVFLVNFFPQFDSLICFLVE